MKAFRARPSAMTDRGGSRPMPRASIGGTVLLEKRGWCLKKSKTDKSWARAHHTPRYFVSRGHALS